MARQKQECGLNLPASELRDLYDEDYWLHDEAPDNWRVFSISRGRVLLPNRLWALGQARLRPGMRVLDVGCGRGELAMFCGAAGVDAFGIDFSDVAMNLGQGCLGFFSENERDRIHMDLWDAGRRLPFQDALFDRVMSWAVLEHLAVSQRKHLFAEVCRVLKPEGITIHGTCPNRWRWKLSQAADKCLRRREPDSRYAPLHVAVMSPLQLKHELEQANFHTHVWVEAGPSPGNLKGQTIAALGRMPALKWVFAWHVMGIGAKSPQSLKAFRNLEPIPPPWEKWAIQLAARRTP